MFRVQGIMGIMGITGIMGFEVSGQGSVRVSGFYAVFFEGKHLHVQASRVQITVPFPYAAVQPYSAVSP